MNPYKLGIWEERADQAQEALDTLFWNESIGMYDIETPRPDGEGNPIFHYWWMAHAVDVLVDGLLRNGGERYTVRLAELHAGLLRRNGGVWPNELYDDMEWMAIAWLRAYQATGREEYKDTAAVLWEDIRTGWNGHMDGGIAWQKSQLDYKNTPANAPAVILAARLYQAFGDAKDLEWALTIYEWLKNHLVDAGTGFVWDGMNRTGDGSIDKEWKYTYNQGVYIGAAVELYRITGDQSYLEDARRTFAAAIAELADSGSGVLPDEGDGDAGLFKGILVRYTAEWVKADPAAVNARSFLRANAELLWEQGRSAEAALFGTNWITAATGTVSLSSQLSGIMLLEQVAELKKESWNERADGFQRSLQDHYYNAETGIMNQWYPRENNAKTDNFYYWWQAHVIDVLVDAYERTGEAAWAARIQQLSRSLRAYNGGTFSHNYYDDMEWTALALLRAYKAVGDEEYKQAVLELWADITTAWNDHIGGGMAWKKDQLDYKNTPANAPAAILAARLYETFHEEQYLQWAIRIYEWNKENLVDPVTGFVWDGMNRLGDGRIDYDWEFTYCQGVFLGAGLALYRNTGKLNYLEDAKRTAGACMDRLCHPVTKLLPDEGIDDTGLFKGILIRYLVQLCRECPDLEQVREMIFINARRLWEEGMNKQLGLCGPSWEQKPQLPVQLSVQLSGLMLLEGAAVLQASIQN